MASGGMTASFADQAVRLIIRLSRHPATQTLINHAIRLATIQVVRAVQHHTRTRKGHMTL